MIQLMTSMSKPKAGSSAEPMAKPIPPTTRMTPSAQNAVGEHPEHEADHDGGDDAQDGDEKAIAEDEVDRLRADDGAEDEAEDREDGPEEAIAEEHGDQPDGNGDQRDEQILQLSTPLCGRALGGASWPALYSCPTTGCSVSTPRSDGQKNRNHAGDDPDSERHHPDLASPTTVTSEGFRNR